MELKIELKKVQNKRKYLYKILKIYLNKLFEGKINYNEYMIVENLKKEIEYLNSQGKEIVKKICENNIENRKEKLFENEIIAIGV